MTESDLRIAILEEARQLSDDATENQPSHLSNIISLAQAMIILLK